MVNRHSGGFDFLKQILNFFWVRVRARYKLSLVFRLSPVCSKFKFKFSAGVQLFGLKTTSHGKLDLKNEFLSLGLPCEMVFRQKSCILAENLNLNLLQTGLSLKTRLELYLALILTQKKFLNLFSKNQMHHYTHSPRKRTAWCVNICPRKGGITSDTIRGTPCSLNPQYHCKQFTLSIK